MTLDTKMPAVRPAIGRSRKTVRIGQFASPREVLEGFIRDLCALHGSHGSDERDKAQAYYDRSMIAAGYPYLNDS